MYQINGADVKFIASVTLAGATWVADLAAWMQIAATAVAIVAGTAAAWYHIERALEFHRQRKIRDRDAIKDGKVLDNGRE